MAAKVKLPKYVYYKGGGRHKTKTLWFERQGWTTVKFQNQDPRSAEFFAEYASMMRGEREERTLADERDSRRTFRKLIRSYEKSVRYKKLADSTRPAYDRVLRALLKIMPEVDPRKIRRKDVIKFRDANADKPRFANYCVQVMRILMEHSIDIGWTDTNHAKGVKLFPPSKAKRLPWPPALVDEFRKVAGPRELLVFELLLGTGQRIGDVLDMQWHEISEGGIYVVQNKTGKHLWVPFGTRLLTLLGNTQKQSMFIVTNPSGGNKWTYDGAQKAIIKIRNKIGAEKYDIHSLRYSAASELMMAGCSVAEISAITGQTEEMVNHYTAAVRQKALANSARAALERTQF